jgi:hypothetical protein
MSQQIGEYYTLTAAAAALGLSYWVVYGYVRRKRVPTIRIGQTLLVKLADLSELAAPAAPVSYRVMGHVCPQCGDHALVYEEGCQKCYACGYAAC